MAPNKGFPIQRPPHNPDAHIIRNEAQQEPVGSLSDFASGALAGFAVGMVPFLVMLAIMVFAS